MAAILLKPQWRSLLLAALSVVVGRQMAAAQTPAIDYNKQIRPLRRTVVTSATAPTRRLVRAGYGSICATRPWAKGESGQTAIAPGKAGEYRRWPDLSSDPDQKMPPPGSGMELPRFSRRLIWYNCT